MEWLTGGPKPSSHGFMSSASSSLMKSFLPGSSSSGGMSWLSLAGGSKDQGWFQSVVRKFGFHGTIVSILSFVLYAGYLKFVKKDEKALHKLLLQELSSFVPKFPGIGHLFGPLKKLVGKQAKSSLPKATESALASIAGTGEGILSKLNPRNWKMFNHRKIAEEEDDAKFQAGEPYGDPHVLAPTLADDLKAIGIKTGLKDLHTLLETAKSVGKPMDDRELIMEKIIALVTTLPRNSKARTKLTGVLIDKLWSSLPHPPLSYLGNKHQYRTADGSCNNPMQPDLGKAGTPYARSVPRLKRQHGVQPDPGLLFDLLMCRTDESFKENPAGISSMLFYHATIIIHDIFRSNRFDPTVSDTSSYLDLAPLYGSSLNEQLKVRAMHRGLLKPDSFSEKRLLGMPPGVNVILVMYNRFHNYVADMLLKINEGGRFSLPPTKTAEEKQRALAKQDEDLFQTARLVVNGLYVNISLHDYIRGLTNVHHSASDWTLDPRVQVNKLFDSHGTPRGIGNQVSIEFNLLYRFHSVISRRDEKWLNESFKTIFGDKPVDQLTPQEFMQGFYRMEQMIPEDPARREFGGLNRDQQGRFNDAELVKVMKESMEDPAGIFGPRMVPKALRVIEIIGIIQSRRYQLGSLNEARDLFKLKRHETFEDMNPNNDIADLLRKLYDDPDMVEMYPGLFLEDAKPRMDPGHGACISYTAGRAILSDAVSLVRSDRFLTIDYTTANLTNWGYKEVQQNYDILGGSMFYKLFQRAFPGWFPYNSLHIMQPMYTRKMNEQIAREIGTIDQYSLDDPAPPPTKVMVTKHSATTKVLKDQANFHVTWAKYCNDLIPGKDLSGYMLLGDKPANTSQKDLVKHILYSPREFQQLLSETALSVARELIESETLSLRNDLHQVDIIRDVAIPMMTRLLADLFSLDLESQENKNGSMGVAELYGHIMNVRVFGFENLDPALALERRLVAQEGARVLSSTTADVIKRLPSSSGVGKELVAKAKGIVSKIPLVGRLVGEEGHGSKDQSKAGSLRWYGYNVAKEMLAAGKSTEEVADISWMNAVGGVGATIGVFTDVLSFFLADQNSHHWEQVQKLASTPSTDTAANKSLRQYVLEAQRMTSNQQNIRICTGETTVGDQQIKPGQLVVCSMAAACKDPEAVPEPDAFKLGRPDEAYIHFGYGPHECLGREIALTGIVALVWACAGLKNLRPAPGEMGVLKAIQTETGKQYLNDNWSYVNVDPSTWKVHYEGHGKGVHKPPEVPVTAGRDMNALSNALVKQHNQGVQQAAPQMANGGIGTPLTHMMHPSAQGHGAPLASHFAGAPATNDVSRGHPDLSTHFASSAVGLPKQALGVAHDAVHSTLDHIPGGQQATNFAHGLADGVAYPGHLFSGVDNAARQVPAHLF